MSLRNSMKKDDHIEERLIYHQVDEKKQEKRDCDSICLLMLLYILQGIPLGLAGSIPMILQQHNVPYKDQATFTLAFWPFSIKLLWAPIVDSCFFSWMGRRKSWLVPAQYLIGIFMLVLSQTIEYLLQKEEGQESPHIVLITSVFFCLNFLAATQDIAVDGWALTILSKKNLGWASTCNSVGQTAGYCLGYVVFLALESKDFCRNYLGLQDSLVTLPGFFLFWGIVFIITTTAVWLLKPERNERSEMNEEDLGMIETYKVVAKMLKMPSLQSMILILLTAKIGFAASDSLTVLKLTEEGVPKEQLALLSIPLTPLQIILPLYISKFTTGPQPMNTFLKAYVPRLLFGLVFAGLVWITPLFKDDKGNFGFEFYSLVVIIYILHQITANCMFVAQMAFYAQISDPKVGGTYMTLLNTFTNLGGNWPSYFALRFVSEVTWKMCLNKSTADNSVYCNSPSELETCQKLGGTCITQLDGYYVETAVLIMIGFIWYRWGSKTIRKLQQLPKTAWHVKSK